MRFRQSPEAVSSTLGNDVMVSLTTTGRYRCLTGTATELWQLLEVPRTLPDIVQRLETPPGGGIAVRDDVEVVLHELLCLGLVEEVIDGEV